MSLLTLDDGSEPPKPVEPPARIECDPYDGVTIDSRAADVSALMTLMDGSTWTLERYYQQILGGDNEPTPQALAVDAPWQQYRLILNMDIKVTSELSYDQETVVGTFDVTGSGVTFPFIVPNKGDMFVARTTDGRQLVFTLSRAKRNTILKGSAYQIDYKGVGYWDAEREADFKRKTQVTLVYSQQGLFNGCGPLLTESATADMAYYKERLAELLDNYLTDFYSPARGTLLVPDQNHVRQYNQQASDTYDHFLTRYMLQLFDAIADPRMRKVRLQNVDAEPVMKTRTVWDALIMRRTGYIRTGIRNTYLISTGYFRGRPELQGLGYTGIGFVVCPLNPATDVDSRNKQKDLAIKPGSVLQSGLVRRRDWTQLQTPDYSEQPWYHGSISAEGLVVSPMLKPVTVDDFYVFSQAFYNGDTASMSMLEQLLTAAVNKESMKHEQLKSLLASAMDWTSLERYYYHPALFYLIKTVIGI